MNRRTKIGASVAAGATAVLAATAIAVASPSTSAQADDATQNPTSTATANQGHTPETPLTGSDAEKATAAAKEAVPGGTIIRVETDSDGEASYEAHVRKSDGTEVVVLMDDGFNVTSVEEFAGRGGRGGGGGRGGPNETPLTGQDAEKATAAAKAAVEGGTVIRVETDADGGATYEAHVRKSDGTEVVVLMNADFTVKSVEEFTGGRGGRGHGRGDGNRDGDRDGDTSDDATASPSSTTSA
jgi:uncharacterized membrane protein YkoI